MVLYIDSWPQGDCTLGRLFYEDFKCFTLELPWLDNAKSISCIPEGHYKAKKHVSPSLGDVIHIYNVQGRTWIYIHAGNFTRQIEGCILVGDGIKYIDNDTIPDVSNSKNTFLKLFNALPESFDVEIKRA